MYLPPVWDCMLLTLERFKKNILYITNGVVIGPY